MRAFFIGKKLIKFTREIKNEKKSPFIKSNSSVGCRFNNASVVRRAELYDPNDDYKQLDVKFFENEKPNQGFYLNSAANYVLETVDNPTVGSVGGEWSVMI